MLRGLDFHALSSPLVARSSRLILLSLDLLA
jgi:hypothetical protein